MISSELSVMKSTLRLSMYCNILWYILTILLYPWYMSIQNLSAIKGWKNLGIIVLKKLKDVPWLYHCHSNIDIFPWTIERMHILRVFCFVKLQKQIYSIHVHYTSEWETNHFTYTSYLSNFIVINNFGVYCCFYFFFLNNMLR